MQSDSSNRNRQIILGVVLVMLGLAGWLGIFWGAIATIFGGYLLYRNLSSNFTSSRPPRRRPENRSTGSFKVAPPNRESSRRDFPRAASARPEPPPYQGRRPLNLDGTPRPVDRVDNQGVFGHAEAAMRASGIDPATTPVLPTDIGLMAITLNQEPVVHRSAPVLDDADLLQPFVSLRLRQPASGRVRFEISDADNQTLFVHEEVYQLRRGDNLLTPAARLRLHSAQNRHAGWHLRVSADGVPLADHMFTWAEDSSQAIRRHLSGEGEMSNELRQMIAENRLSDDRVSLDDLLGDQDESGTQTRGNGRG